MTQMMKPIAFQCRQAIPRSAVDIGLSIADTAQWNGFKGYAVLPGVAHAAYEQRTAGMVGSRIRVRNTDGSQHVEEIHRWEPGQAIEIRLQEFTPPLRYLATHIDEEWTFQPAGAATLVTRSFRLYPAHPAARPLLWLIALLFRRAVQQHLVAMGLAEAA